VQQKQKSEIKVNSPQTFSSGAFEPQGIVYAMYADESCRTGRDTGFAEPVAISFAERLTQAKRRARPIDTHPET
jgi:hypothetical protein